VPDLVLQVGDARYSGWETVGVVLSLEQLAGTFQLSVSERWPAPDAQADRRRILPGEACTVRLAGEPVLKGYVDAVFPSYGPDSHTVEVWGRDATADLVDCSAVHKGGRWKNKDLAAIARDLANPFGLQVVEGEDVGGPFANAAIQEGESVFELLERLAKQRGLLVWSDGTGGVILGKPHPRDLKTQLERGVNIESAKGEFSRRDRCSVYIVKGQMPGTDDTFGAAAAGPTAKVPDEGVGRYRPLVVLSEAAGGIAAYKQRAAYERDVRRAKGSRVTYTVAGWAHAEGLWEVNTLVPVVDDWMDLHQVMLVAGVTFRAGADGSRTDLTLVQPDALDMIPLEPKKKKKGGSPW
jgi:prophage tail gpP-like protein